MRRYEDEGEEEEEQEAEEESESGDTSSRVSSWFCFRFVQTIKLRLLFGLFTVRVNVKNFDLLQSVYAH